MDTHSAAQDFTNSASPPQGWENGLFFKNAQGKKIHYGHAPARGGDMKGAIVLTHGYGEHIDLYHEAIRRYQAMGFAVWGMDWQGFGKSDRDDPAQPQKPPSKSMMEHADDLDLFIREIVRKQHPADKPLILSTHSMGGHIGLLHLKKYPGTFTAAIMSAPMFDLYRLGLGDWARSSVKTVFEAACKAGLEETPLPGMDNLISILPENGKQFLDLLGKKQDSLRRNWKNMMHALTPDAHVEKPSFGWVLQKYETIEISMEETFLQTIETPVLIGSAENDTLVANDSHEYAAKLLPQGRHVEIKNADHGIWFEEDGPFEEWWNHVKTFVQDTLTKPAPKAAATVSLFEQIYGISLTKYRAEKRKPD